MAIYGLILHDDIEQASRLISHLPSGKIIVHCEDRSLSKELNQRFAGKREMKFVQRVSVNWGGFSIVKAIWNILNESVPLLEKGEHVVLLSGHDYLLRPISEFEDYLKESDFTEHIKYFAISADMFRAKKFIKYHFWDLRFQKFKRNRLAWRLNTMFIRLLGLIVNLIFNKKSLPSKYELSMGSVWFALTKEAIVELQNERSKGFDRFFRYTFTSDESYFHTLISGTEFGKKNLDRGLTQVNLRDQNLMSNYTHLCGNPSRWHTESDWEEIASSDDFFFRKVRSLDCGSLLDRVDRELINNDGKKI